jgi:anaerobic magnesium-protoporphyrin IX monomethyl ester cyclase
MKIILINPPFNRYGGIEGHGGNVLPLNLCCLAAYIRRLWPEIEVRILDAEIKGLSHEEAVSEAVSFSPDCIGITANTCVFDSVQRLVGLLKASLPNIPVIVGGPHPSALPESSLRETKADLAVIGEGEKTFGEIINQLKNKQADWGRINGLAYWADRDEIKITPLRGLIDNLDELPFPDRSLVENKLYSPPPTKRVGLGMSTLIYTSRGCPFGCGFCAAHTVWTHKIRTRSPESVVSEIESCVNDYNIRVFNFIDELFTVNKKRVMDICNLILERRLDIRWVCSARAQGLDLETLKLMKKAGCHEISFGIESGNPDILKKINKGIDLEEARRVIRLTKKAGISTHTSYILGYIGETEDTILDTIRFAKKLNTHVAAFFIASPLPGTELYKEALAKKLLNPAATWLNYSPLSNTESVLVLPELPIATIRKWHRWALKTYYFRPAYIFLRLFSIRHWYEIVNLFDGLKIFLKIKK